MVEANCMNRMRFAVLVFVVVDLCGLLVCGQLSAGQLPCEVEKSARAQVVMVSAAEGACAAGIQNARSLLSEVRQKDHRIGSSPGAAD